MESLYKFLYETIDLKTMGLVLGIVLVVTHGFALVSGSKLSSWLVKLPRSRKLGIIILAVDALWAYVVISYMDLGEFFTIRRGIQIAIPIAFFLVITYVDEFLAVRAIGVLFLLAACPILESAFLEQPLSRLLLPIFAYAIILKGLFWVGMPYLMRDGITWVTGKPERWTAACSAGALYGFAVIVCAVAFY